MSTLHLFFFSSFAMSCIFPHAARYLPGTIPGSLYAQGPMKSCSHQILFSSSPHETCTPFLQVPMKSEKCWEPGGRKDCLSHPSTVSKCPSVHVQSVAQQPRDQPCWHSCAGPLGDPLVTVMRLFLVGCPRGCQANPTR